MSDRLTLPAETRIKGGKVFDTDAKWFTKLMKDIGQPVGKQVVVSHGGDD